MEFVMWVIGIAIGCAVSFAVFARQNRKLTEENRRLEEKVATLNIPVPVIRREEVQTALIRRTVEVPYRWGYDDTEAVDDLVKNEMIEKLGEDCLQYAVLHKKREPLTDSLLVSADLRVVIRESEWEETAV